MFTEEIRITKEKLILNLKCWHVLKRLEDKYYNLRNNDKIFTFHYCGLHKEEIYEDAIHYLTSRVNTKVGFTFVTVNGHKKENVRNAIKKIKEYKLEDTIEYFSKVINNDNWNRFKPTIEKDSISICFSEYYLRLLLNALNILINNKLEEEEIIKKASEALRVNNTIIYRNIKITMFKNGKTKLTFADKETQNKFEKLIK